MIDYIKICDDFVSRLRKIEEVNEKRSAIWSNDEFIDALMELQQTDKLQFDRIIENASDQFPRGKTKIIDRIKDMIKDKKQQKTREKINEFTTVDLSKLPMKNGQIIPTVDSLSQILLGGKQFDFFFDEMSHEVYFNKISWTPHDKAVTVPIIGSEDVKTYHPYTSSKINKTGLQQSMNKAGFSNEISFTKLAESMEFAARSKKIDLCVEWINSCDKHFDGIDRLTGDNNFLVKYCGVQKGQWADACARLLPLAIVTRIMSPGWPLRYYFAIEGEQNIGKSKLCRTLVPSQWYTSASINSHENMVEYYRLTYNKVSIELAEQGGTDRTSVNMFKRMTTEHESEFRGLYEPHVKHPKRSVIILTTNEYEYLRDPTGDTRCIPIKSLLKKNQFFNWDGIENELPMIYAQALDMYKRGDRPNLTQEEIIIQEQETNKRDMISQSWEYDVVERYLELNDNRDNADKYGICTKLIYDYLTGNFGGGLGPTEYQLSSKHSRSLGVAFIKHGYTERGKRNCTHPNIIGGTHQMWWKPGTF
jgi:hypothetical protein